MHSWTCDNILFTNTTTKCRSHYYWNCSVITYSTLLYFGGLLFSCWAVHLHTECLVWYFQVTQMHNYKFILWWGRKILSSGHCVISAFFELTGAYSLWQFLMQQLCCITCSVISSGLGWKLYTHKHFDVNKKCVSFAHRVILCIEINLKQLHS